MSIELKQVAEQSLDLSTPTLREMVTRHAAVIDSRATLEDMPEALAFQIDMARALLREFTAIQQAEAQQPATGEPVKATPYNPTEEMRWAMKRIDPALSSEQCRALWSAAWSASPSTHPAPSVPMTERELELIDGMVALQLGHAQRCDAISNRDMAEKQKGWDMERVELLRRIRSLGITAHAQKGTNGEIN